MQTRVTVSQAQCDLLRRVEKKPRGTILRYGLTSRKKLDDLVKAGLLWVDHGKRWGMPARYVPRVGVDYDVRG